MPPKKKGTKKKSKKKVSKKPSKKTSKNEEIQEENDLTDTEINNQDDDIEENSNSDSDNLDDEDLPEEEDEDLPEEEEDEDEDSELEEPEELFKEDYELLLKQKDIDNNPDNKLDNDKLSIYEQTRILGTRSKQISAGAKAFIKNNVDLTVINTAKEELKNRLVPIELLRTMPNGTVETWKINEFK